MCNYFSFYHFQADCSDLLKFNSTWPTGVYEVSTWRTSTKARVYCDMETNGGGWTVCSLLPGFCLTNISLSYTCKLYNSWLHLNKKWNMCFKRLVKMVLYNSWKLLSMFYTYTCSIFSLVSCHHRLVHFNIFLWEGDTFLLLIYCSILKTLAPDI